MGILSNDVTIAGLSDGFPGSHGSSLAAAQLGNSMSAAQFGKLAAAEQRECVQSLQVLARVEPAHKQRLVETLQSLGEVRRLLRVSDTKVSDTYKSF